MGRCRRKLLLWHLNRYRSEQTLSSGTLRLGRHLPFTFWLSALWFVISSANCLALENLLFSASPWWKLQASCQHKAFLPLRGRKGAVFRSSFLSVSFLVLPLSQNNFVSLGLHCMLPVTVWVPQPRPGLRCSLKDPLSTSTTEAIEATGRSEKLPDGGCGKARGTKGYSSAWPGCSFSEKGNRLSPWSRSWPTGKKIWPLVLLSLNYLCYGTTRRPCPPPGQVHSWQFVLCHIQWIRWGDKDPTVLSALLLPLAASTHLHPCKWFPLWSVRRLI